MQNLRSILGKARLLVVWWLCGELKLSVCFTLTSILISAQMVVDGYADSSSE